MLGRLDMMSSKRIKSMNMLLIWEDVDGTFRTE